MVDDISHFRYDSLQKFIFVTFEGSTFQPDSDSVEPDIENMQVIGTSEGYSRYEAYEMLITQNQYLLDTKFDEIWCFRLADDGKYDCMFSLEEMRSKGNESQSLVTPNHQDIGVRNNSTEPEASFHITRGEIEEVVGRSITVDEMKKVSDWIENDEGIWEEIESKTRGDSLTLK